MATAGRRLLLVVMVLLAGDAAAVAGAAPAPGVCGVAAFATAVASSCAAGVASPACCEPVLATVGLGGGDCLCRVSGEMAVLHAGLNSSALMALYSACGGARVVTACHGTEAVGIPVIAVQAAASSPAVAPAHARPAALAPPATAATTTTVATAAMSKAAIGTAVVSDQGSPCDSSLLAEQIVNLCNSYPPSNECCSNIVPALDIGGCLCLVLEESTIQYANITGSGLVTWYSACVGKNPNADPATCSAQNGGRAASPPPPPPPPSPSTPSTGAGAHDAVVFEEHLSHDDRILLYFAEVFGASQTVVGLVLLVWRIIKLGWKYRSRREGGNKAPVSPRQASYRSRDVLEAVEHEFDVVDNVMRERRRAAP